MRTAGFLAGLAAVSLIMCGCTELETPSPSPNAENLLIDPQAYEEHLAGIASMYGLTELPPVDIRRVIEPHEWQSVLNQCMTEQGFRKLPDGTWPGIPIDQKDTFNTALYVCHGSYPVPTIYNQPWSEEQKRAMYRYTVDTLIPCLKSEEDIVIVDIPSEETFVDSFDSAPWWPYEQVDYSGMTQSEVDSLNSRCPQTPPLSLLLGSRS